MHQLTRKIIHGNEIVSEDGCRLYADCDTNETAAHIVKCVNMHEQLVADLYNLVSDIRQGITFFNDARLERIERLLTEAKEQ